MSIRTCIVLFLLAALNPAFSQRIISPDVQADGRITFRLRAPNAKEVQVQCEGVTDHKMEKEDTKSGRSTRRAPMGCIFKSIRGRGGGQVVLVLAIIPPRYRWPISGLLRTSLLLP